MKLKVQLMFDPGAPSVYEGLLTVETNISRTMFIKIIVGKSNAQTIISLPSCVCRPENKMEVSLKRPILMIPSRDIHQKINRKSNKI